MDLIYVKDIDKSLLYQGFTIRTSLLKYFMENLRNYLLVKIEKFLSY